MALRLDWPEVVLSGMVRHQLELEQMCHECKKRYCTAQAGLCETCGKVIKLDMARHVANQHMELAWLCRCPVPWYTIWKGMPQDCIDHICGWLMRCRLRLRWLIWDVTSRHGRFPGLYGDTPCVRWYQECQQMLCCLAGKGSGWYIDIVSIVDTAHTSP